MVTDRNHFSVGLISPSWPAEESTNGIVRYVGFMSTELRARDVGVHVITGRADSESEFVHPVRCSAAERGWGKEMLDRLGRRLTPGLHKARAWGAALVSAIERLRRGADLRLVEIEEAFGVAGYVALHSSVPVVVRLHGPWFLNGAVDGERPNRRFRERVRLEGLGIARAAAVTAPSQDVLDRVRGYYRLALPKAEVIPPPTSPIPPAQRWSQGACEPSRLLFIGRMDRHKGADIVVRAFGLVARACPEARLTLVGPDRGTTDDSGWRGSVIELVQRYIPGGLASGQVEWLGPRRPAELVELRQRCFLTIVPSRYETFGLTAVEAMASGCPTIIADAGGLSEIACHGRNSLTFRPGDADDLADKILFLLANPGFAAELGRRAAEDAWERYCPETIAGRILQFYRRLLDARSAVPRFESEAVC